MIIKKTIQNCKLYEIGHLKIFLSQAWWCTPVILAHERLMQEGCELQASLGYLGRPCLNKQTNQNEKYLLG
jgi:hypothetical protein